MLEQFLAALIDFLLRLEVRLRGDGIELRLLNLLREAGINGGHVVGVRLLEIALAGLCGGGQVLVFQVGKQLSFFYVRASLYMKFFDGRADLRSNGCLLQGIDHGFRGNHLRDGGALRRRSLHGDNRLLFLFVLAATAGEAEYCGDSTEKECRSAARRQGGDHCRSHGVVRTPVSVCKLARATR